MAVLTTPNIFSPGQPILSALMDANFQAIVTWSTNIDNSNIGPAGLFASQLVPLTAGEATFGGALGYKFFPNAAAVTPLTISGTSGQSADIFDVTLTSGGTKAFYVDRLGNAISGNLVSTALATFSTPSVSLGDIIAQQSASAGAIALGGATEHVYLDYDVSSPHILTITAFGGLATAALRVTNSIGAGVAAYIGPSGVVSSALSTTTGQFTFGGSGTSLTGSGSLFFDGALYNFFSVNSSGSTAHIAASTGVYTATSDARLKENVAPISHGLAELMFLEPVQFDWIADKTPGQGFIAQKLQQIIPNAVSIVDAKSGILGVSDAMITPVVVKALQELATAFQSYVAAHP